MSWMDKVFSDTAGWVLVVLGLVVGALCLVAGSYAVGVFDLIAAGVCAAIIKST